MLNPEEIYSLVKSVGGVVDIIERIGHQIKSVIQKDKKVKEGKPEEDKEIIVIPNDLLKILSLAQLAEAAKRKAPRYLIIANDDHIRVESDLTVAAGKRVPSLPV